MGNTKKLQKVKKQRKPMDPQVKRNLINGFKSIISNQAVIDGAKETPWWVAVIFFVLSICLPVIPITVQYSKAYGASFVSSYSFNSDRGIENTFTKAKADGWEIKVENNLLTFNKDVTDDFIASDINAETGQYNFLLYVSNKTGSELGAFVNKLDAAKYELGKTNPYDETKAEQYTAEGTKFYTPGFVVLAKDTMAMAVYKDNSTERAGASLGGLDWHNSPSGDLLERVLKVDESLTHRQKTEAIFNNWKSVLNETYINQKNTTMLNMSLIYLGIYAGLLVFLGLMVFVLTRGKNNVYRYLNVWVCQKISWWAAFTPAVLGMIVGFLLAGNVIGQMAFIVLASLRVMWMSMRQLRPIQ